MTATLRASSETRRLDPWKTWPVTVRRLRSESPGVFTIDLEFHDTQVGQRFRYAPGQFNMLYVPGIGEAAISISGTTVKGHLQHTIRGVGAVTRSLEAGGAGMCLGLRGPFGRPWPLELFAAAPQKLDLIIIAGGIGLAPLRELINRIAMERQLLGEVHLLVGARTPLDLLYAEQYDGWMGQEMMVDVTVDRAPSSWKGHTGVVTLLLERIMIARPESTLVMTCGPEVMMRYVAKSAVGRGIPEANIWVTLERNMNCAIGLCGHCQLGPKFLCKEGPIFRYDEVSAWLRVQGL